MSRVHPVVVLALLGLLLASYAWAKGDEQSAASDIFRIRLLIVDEAGAPVHGAVLRLRSRVVTAADGTAVVDTDQPEAGVAVADGYLPEPVVLSREVAPRLTLRLWSTHAPDGTPRLSFHFGGDTMLGRRFVKPIRPDTPRLARDDGGRSAREVVTEVAPLFGAADVSTLNLETVVGDLPPRGAYSSKRFLLQTPPAALAALTELGVDTVTLGNNHANDWEDRGVTSTRQALAAAGIPFTGAGESDGQAREPAVLERRGRKIGVLSYTTVTGDFVNDHLPTRAAPVPLDLPGPEQWQYAFRPYGFGAKDEQAHLPASSYRAGDVWRWFRDLRGLGPATEERIWNDLRKVFPELQDWVARRGHGGAAAFSRNKVADDVAVLRKAGADLVVVQIHGGFQFSEVASAFFRRSSHASIDAGADLVIGHHPHVLQGFEWYRGRLVVHSLGNFVFDQDFLMTFPSVFVRTVFEGDRLLEARVYPLLLDRYRPVPLVGAAASRIVRELRSDSELAAPADRTTDGNIARVADSTLDERGVARADLVLDGNAAVVIRPGGSRTTSLSVAEDGVAEVPLPLVLRPDALPSATLVGLDLLRFGDPDDTTANGSIDGGANWDLQAARRVEVVALDRATGNLGFRLHSVELRSATIRPIARVMRRSHRFRHANGDAADGTASYTVRLRVRNAGRTRAFLRFDLYRFDDSNPLRDPESEFLRRVSIPLALPSDDRWQTISVPVPAQVFRSFRGRFVNSAMLYLGLEKGQRREVFVDRVQVLEWRAAGSFPRELWLEADALVPAAGEKTLDAVVR